MRTSLGQKDGPDGELLWDASLPFMGSVVRIDECISINRNQLQ